MTPTTVAGVLTYFTAAWPWIDAGEETLIVWAEALHRYDDDIAQVAMKRLVKSEDRPPSIKRFADECDKVTRDRLPRLAPGPQTQLDKQVSANISRAIRAGMLAAAKDIPEHRNHDRNGGANCPACSTRAARAHVPGEVMDAIRDSLAGGGA